MSDLGIVHSADNNKRDNQANLEPETHLITRAQSLSSKPWWAAWWHVCRGEDEEEEEEEQQQQEEGSSVSV